MSTLPNSRFAAVALGAVLVLTCWPAVSAAGSQVAWTTPKAMAAKIHGMVPQIPTTNTSAPSTITATTCHGRGASHSGKFQVFRCKAHWERGVSVVWARALPTGKFCASSTGLSACPAAAPTAGDPRICSHAPVPPTADPNRCALAATETAVLRAMKANFQDPTWELGNVSCQGSNLTRKCTFMKLNVYGIYYTSKVRFQAKGAWTATIVTTGGNGTSTCTVHPDPSTDAGKPSNWASGPTPTCTR